MVGQDAQLRSYRQTLCDVGADGAIAQHNLCQTSDLKNALLIYQGLLLVAGCVLSFLTRNNDPEFSESKSLMVVVYVSRVIVCRASGVCV